MDPALPPRQRTNGRGERTLPVMKLVEVINTDETAQDVLDTVRNCAKTRKVAVSLSLIHI